MRHLSILHVIDSLDPFGGASVACVRLAASLATRPGFSVAIASRKPPQAWAAGAFDHCTLHLWDDEADPPKLDAAIDAADVVHLHGVWDRVLRLAATACTARGKPYAVTPHGMLADWPMSQKPLKKRFYLHTFGRRLLRDAHAIHFTAEQERRQSERRFGHGRVWVAPLINDLTTDLAASDYLPPRSPPVDPAQRPITLFLSRLHRKKGPDRAINMLAYLPGVELWIAGRDNPVYRAELEHLAQGLGVDDRIRWVGEVDEAEKRQLYQTAHALVLPTHQENFGQVLVEAMANGLPVITTRNVDIWREIESGGAVIADPEASAFAHAVKALFEDPVHCAARSTRGRAFVRQWLDPEAGLQAYRPWYESLIRTSSEIT
ncbi:MAG: glycosyltransferase [Planctomycetota bacterium]